MPDLNHQLAGTPLKKLRLEVSVICKNRADASITVPLLKLIVALKRSSFQQPGFDWIVTAQSKWKCWSFVFSRDPSWH